MTPIEEQNQRMLNLAKAQDQAINQAILLTVKWDDIRRDTDLVVENLQALQAMHNEYIKAAVEFFSQVNGYLLFNIRQEAAQINSDQAQQ